MTCAPWLTYVTPLDTGFPSYKVGIIIQHSVDIWIEWDDKCKTSRTLAYSKCSINDDCGVIWWSSEGMGWYTYIYKADIQFLGCVPSLEVTSGINIIVSDNSGDDVWCWDAFCSLRWNKHSCSSRKEEKKRKTMIVWWTHFFLMALLLRDKVAYPRCLSKAFTSGPRWLFQDQFWMFPPCSKHCLSSWICSLDAPCIRLDPGIFPTLSFCLRSPFPAHMGDNILPHSAAFSFKVMPLENLFWHHEAESTTFTT